MISNRFICFLIAVATLAVYSAVNCAANCGSCGVGPATCATNDMSSCKACMTNGHTKAAHHLAMVRTTTLVQMIASNTPMVIVDARAGKYDDGRRIPGAKQLAPDASNEDIAKALPDKDALIVVYCVNPKCPASKQLAMRLIALGYTKVQKYPEGIEGWIKDGNKVEKVK